jgi:hypothetical protein
MCTPTLLHKLLGQKPSDIPECPALAASGRTGKCDKPLVRQCFLNQGNVSCCKDGSCFLFEQYPGASRLELRELPVS